MYRHIKYGDYECSQWNGIINLEDPLFQAWLGAIKPHLEGYELWIYGGVLEPWLSFDIDASLIGPLDSNKINRVLDNIIRVSFEYGLFPDIKYVFDGRLFHWSYWEATGRHTVCKYAYYKPEMIVNHKKIQWGRLENNLWVAERIWPMKKTLYKNHNYQDPIRIL